MVFKVAFDPGDWVGIVVPIAVAIVLGIVWVRDKTNTHKHFKKFATKSWFAYALYIGLIVTLISPVMFYQDTWIWRSIGGGIKDYEMGTGHLKLNPGEDLTGVDITFKFTDGLDLDGNTPSTNVASITGGIYSANSYAMSLYEDHWFDNEMSLNDLSELTGLTLLDTFTASSGVVTTTSNKYSSGQIVYVEAGTYNADETGNYPLKSQWYKAIVQRSSDVTDDTVNLGMYTFEFYTPPDDDTDLTFALVTDTFGAISSTTLDWSDEGDNVVETAISITFADDDAIMRSYYDRANERWYDWYAVGTITERNCTTSEGLTIARAEGLSHAEQSLSNAFNFYIKISTGHIYTDNQIPAGTIGYLSNAAGNEHDDYPSVWYIDVDFDLTGCTSAGGTDNYYELLITMDFGTWYNPVNLLNGGTITDDTTANNFKNDFASTYYIVT